MTGLRSQRSLIREGSPNPFEALYAEPARLKKFLKAMSGVSHGANLAIARNFPWSKYRIAVDVGTAQGDLITQVPVQRVAKFGRVFGNHAFELLDMLA
jgi:hypothetical protein